MGQLQAVTTLEVAISRRDDLLYLVEVEVESEAGYKAGTLVQSAHATLA